MGTGFKGAFVISWSQTEVDGLKGAPLSALATGAVWSWQGELLRVDGPSDVLQLDQADGAEELRQRAAGMVKRLVGVALERKATEPQDIADAPLLHTGFVVTDGTSLYTVTLIASGRAKPLLLFVNQIPPRGVDFWIVDTQVENTAVNPHDEGASGVICFTPGTRIETPDGPRLIEELREGDQVSTRDNGAQDVLWTGQRRMSGARLFVMPRLRPIRIRKNALGNDRPEDDLVVSPDHQILVDGPAARDLFNEPEVLVAAKHLVNENSVTIDSGRRHVTYIHLLLPRHEILMANGVPCESFHPANADLDTLSPEDLKRLVAQFPDIGVDPQSYGQTARRTLKDSESALIGHVA